jgi:cyclophilin family peptidyl-prolyl cis-trans isomerase
MNRIRFLLAFALAAVALSAPAQNMPPVVAHQIADFTEYAGANPQSIDLAPAFSDPDASNAVRFTTVLGNIDVALFGAQKPITVDNFLKYVDQGKYFIVDPTTNQLASSFVHRSVPGFVIQGGGFIGTVDPSPTPSSAKDNVRPTSVVTFPPIQNEPGISNKRGTIAMAQMAGNPNSATSQWFINLADNGGPPTNLDIQTSSNGVTSGPYTAFGKVVNNTMNVVDAIAALPRVNAGAPFDTLPVRNYTSPNPIKIQNLVSIFGIAQISPLIFSATSDNSSVSVTISGTKLLVAPNSVGTAHVTVTATDFDGAIVSQMFTVTVVAAPGRLINLSARMLVGTGDNALIAGFIMRGTGSKRLLIRGLGPSLAAFGISNPLVDPVVELHDSTSAVLQSNDNWGDAANQQDVRDLGLQPTSANESAILTTVPSDSNGVGYTAVLRGANNGTGVGVVEVYDVDSGPSPTLLNISTRGQVGTDPNALFAGFTLGGSDSRQILVRAIGPSLTAFGVPNALANPTLDFFNSQGTKVDSNDDWGDSPQKAQIQASGLAPTDGRESAILQTLATGAYTAVVHGKDGGTGVGSVQVYQVQ